MQATHAAQGPISSSVVLPGSCVPSTLREAGRVENPASESCFRQDRSLQELTPRVRNQEREDLLGADRTLTHTETRPAARAELCASINAAAHGRKLHAEQNRRGKLIAFIRAPAFPSLRPAISPAQPPAVRAAGPESGEEEPLNKRAVPFARSDLGAGFDPAQLPAGAPFLPAVKAHFSPTAAQSSPVAASKASHLLSKLLKELILVGKPGAGCG